MELPPRSRAVSPLADHVKAVSIGGVQRENDLKMQSASDVLRRVVLQQGFVAKPTPYAPSGKQEVHPLIDAHTQLHARLQALRDVRQRLRFAPSTDRTDHRFNWRSRDSNDHDSNNNNEDMEFAGTALLSPSLSRFPRDSMEISTRVALSAQANSNEEWVQDGGIVALGGLEMLPFGFLTAAELVTVSAVCQSWYALARRDALWEPLLVTPVEKYPLRPFLGFQSTPLPALQVYIIYRKIRSQLQTLDVKTDQSPRQSAEALRFGGHVRRYDGGDNGLPILMAEIRQRLAQRTPSATARRVGTTAETRGLRNLRFQSVHLVYPADEPLTEEPEHDEAEDDDGEDFRPLHPQARTLFGNLQLDATRGLARPPWAPMPDVPHEEERGNDDLTMALLDTESDEEIWDDRDDGGRDGNGDVAMATPEPAPVELPLQPPAPQSSTTVDGCRRVRLVTWLASHGRVSRSLFRSFARQLLIALTTLELSQYTHSDICAGNIFVLERGGASSSSSNRSSNNQTTTGDDDGEATDLPLFQLYCRTSVNLWSCQRAPLAVDERMQPRRHRNFFRLGADLGDRELDEAPGLLRRLMAARAARPVHLPDVHGQRLGNNPPPTNATFSAMVQAYIRVLREVWCHKRITTTADRTLPLLSFIFQRSQVMRSVSMRSFFEYAEFLASTNDATPSRLLEHVYMQTSEDRRATKDLSNTGSPKFVVGRSSVRPELCGNAEDYRAQVMAFYARQLNARPRCSQSPVSTSILSSTASSPQTLLGPAFFRDALSESRLPHQRFLSVVAPKTASSSWVHTLAVSQRFTLEQLDLSQAQLPLSILLRELYHLQRLTHLRLPREILRDENMEQFIAAVWCVGLLPSLSVMDESVKKALDRMEYGYVTQLNIMSSLLDRSRTQQKLPAVHPSLHHTLSSPF